MAGVAGIEPAAFGFGDRRSSQLSYTPIAHPHIITNLYACFKSKFETALF